MEQATLVLSHCGDLEMHRRRTIGSVIIGGLVVVAVIYAAFGRLGSTAMPMPYVIGTAEFSLQ